MSEFTQPEVTVLLHLLRPAVTPEDVALIAGNLAAEGFNWTKLTEYAIWHRLVPLLARQVRHHVPDLFPADISQVLGQYYEKNRTQCRVLLEELHSVMKSLQRAGINAMAFKGPVFAAQAYRDIAAREYNDLDIIVAGGDYQATLDSLHGLGYSRDRASAHNQAQLAWHYYGQEILFRRRPDMALEPHWRLLPSAFAFNLEYGDLWPNAISLAVEGCSFVTLSPEDTLLALCVHHGKEQWRRLRQVCDLSFYIGNNPGLDWALLAGRARHHGCARVLWLGLYLSRELFATPLPGFIASAIEDDPAAVRLGKQALKCLLSTGHEVTNIHNVSWFRVALHEQLRGKVLFVARTLLVPSNKHFRMIAFPPGLRFLYYPLMWIHDYALLPAWKVCKATALQLSGRNVRG